MPAFSARQLRYLAVVVLTATVVIWGGVLWQFSRSPSAIGSVPAAPTAVAPPIASPAATPLAGPVADSAPIPTTSSPQPTGIPFPRPEFTTSPAPSPTPETTLPPLTSPALPTAPVTSSPVTGAPATGAPGVSPTNPAPNVQPPNVQTKYNHFPYREAEPRRLVQVGIYYDRREFLDQEAALAFKQLTTAARAEGVKIVPISGFRTVAQQEQLFQRQIQRTGGVTAASRLSAPPGYSEHHTGYALDLGDGNMPAADLKYTFADTPTYRWLKQNASRYGFELSFPDGNAQGVSFEPWHWRYIASARAQTIFAAAHSGNLAGNSAKP